MMISHQWHSDGWQMERPPKVALFYLFSDNSIKKEFSTTQLRSDMIFFSQENVMLKNVM